MFKGRYNLEGKFVSFRRSVFEVLWTEAHYISPLAVRLAVQDCIFRAMVLKRQLLCNLQKTLQNRLLGDVHQFLISIEA